MTSEDSGDAVTIGRILGAWGVQGWVQVYSWADPPEALFDYSPWSLAGSASPVSIEQWRRSGQKLVVKLPGVDSPEDAAKLADTPILVQRSQLPAPSAGQYYWHDLLEMEVVNLEGYHWGRVAGILPTGAHDVLKVTTPESGTVLIPFVVDHFVKHVDLNARRIIVDWPEAWAE
jgi:16S rRNA processing protein RimM